MISTDEFVERLCRVAVDRGPRRFPRKRRDREILMKSIVMTLDIGRVYDEAEINARLEDWKREIAPAIETDHVALRRELVDEGQLERTRDGRRYRVGFPTRPVAFDLEIDEIDLRATVAAYLEWADRKREEGRAQADASNERR